MSDFDEESIKFYKNYYGEKFSSKQNENSDNKNKKYYFINEHRKEIKVKGDICFNLKLKNGKFYTLFGSIIKDEREFDDLKEQLSKIIDSPLNKSIMPTTGGLNNIKYAIGNDRFDTFALLLNCYYKESKVFILNAGTKNMYINNRKKLAEFLDSYNNVFDYFQEIYGIDKNLTEKLINNGSKTIIEKTNLYNYINIAIKFWNNRLEQEKIKNYLSKEKVKEYKEILRNCEKIVN